MCSAGVLFSEEEHYQIVLTGNRFQVKKERSIIREIYICEFLSININDFGGLENHLMEHKKYNAWVGRECIDWKYWSAIDKDVVFNKFLNYIEDKQPDVLIVNEMIVSPLERIDFISKIEEMGFSYFLMKQYRAEKYSFTMMFYKNMKCTLFASPNSGYRENRSILYFVEGIYVNGTHFPQESDTKFLNAVEMFL